MDSDPKGAKTKFQRFLRGKSVLFNKNVKFKNFTQSEWREDKFLKGMVGDRLRLRFWNKHQKMHLVFMQLVRYIWIHERVLKYRQSIPENFASK